MLTLIIGSNKVAQKEKAFELVKHKKFVWHLLQNDDDEESTPDVDVVEDMIIRDNDLEDFEGFLRDCESSKVNDAVFIFSEIGEEILNHARNNEITIIEVQ